ncbi:MAG: sigma-70 family RNA polymerase sigma factor [Acidobacteriota bacterium]|nr:sigma-70 family RNA polymerase sigma factor [Acidobacteriota bacterium]
MSTLASSSAGREPLLGRTPEEAVSELVAKLGDKVFAFSMKFCGNREDAEDLVQETFLQAFRKWDQFEGRSSPASWLYTIAARTCQRKKRKRVGEPARMASLEEELPSGLALGAKLPSPDDGPLEEKLRREAVEIVDRALARLPVDYRLPLVLKEIAELSLREIATILEIKEATVKTRVHRGRLALRAELVQSLAKEHQLHTDHSEQVCLDLLQSKMEAMDRGAEFPVRPEDLCERCGAFLQSLDMAADACRWVHGGELSEELRSRLAGGFERTGC